ncbi:hypothetical protein ABZV77_05880 [Streptomyces sp. NPDC004732]|uniref:hypothetical protein n=1 Tax=Streptomyces sp. NPDC004732 TaxID=3154290 RepID=UPI0033A6709B
MSTGWVVVIVIVAAAVGWFVAAVARGIARTARADTRQDLIKFGAIPETGKLLTKGSDLPVYCFMAPFESSRTHPFGWLWWRVDQDTGEKPKQAMGWALTYRRARKAAGIPLSFRAKHVEITLAPGHDRPQSVTDTDAEAQPGTP